MSYDPQQQIPSQQGYYAQQQPPAPYTQGQPPAPAGAGFDFSSFWKNLALKGQITAIAGLVLFIAYFLPWWSVSVSVFGYSESASGSGSAFAGSGLGGAFLLWLVPLAAIALVALPILGMLNKVKSQQVLYGVLGSAGASLLAEIIFLADVGKYTGSYSGLGGSVSAGASFGFYLAILATLAAGGAYAYFTYIKKQ